MTRKVAVGIFYGVLGLLVAVMTVIMVKGFIDQNKDEKQQIARYEELKTPGGKTLLTNEILEQDHDRYLRKAEESKRIFFTLFTCFGLVAVVFILITGFTTVLNIIEDKGGSFAIPLVLFLAMLFCIGSFGIIAMKMIIPSLMYSDPSAEAYYFKELVLKDSLKKEETHESGSGESRTTTTTVYYLLYDVNGKEYSVNKILFDRFEGPGKYYAGQTVGGNIFSLYSDQYFEYKE